MESICYKSKGFGIEANRDFGDEEAKRDCYHGSQTCLSSDLEATMSMIVGGFVVVIMGHDVCTAWQWRRGGMRIRLGSEEKKVGRFYRRANGYRETCKQMSVTHDVVTNRGRVDNIPFILPETRSCPTRSRLH